MKYLLLLAFPTLLLVFIGWSSSSSVHQASGSATAAKHSSHSLSADTVDQYPVQKTEEEWKELLSWREYRVLRSGGTEIPFTNEYYDSKEEGIYYCGACGQPLYLSNTKFASGTGWPSFWEPISANAVDEKEDNILFMTRTEIVCSRCGSHIGHVFEDGPEPTGLRYCMNSQALDFEKADLDSISPAQLSLYKN